MFKFTRAGWLLEVAVGADGKARAWVSDPARTVRGYGVWDGSDWEAIAEAGTSAIAEAVGSPFTGAELDGVKCLRCGKPCGDHRQYKAADVAASQGAARGRPVRFAGRTYRCPLSPWVVGQWQSHEPLPFLG